MKMFPFHKRIAIYRITLYPMFSISRKLNEQQTNQAFKILNHYFEPFHGKVIKIVLAKTNPYQEIKIWDL